jgi:sporulation protein YlmC with PRC-barrel domain
MWPFYTGKERSTERKRSLSTLVALGVLTVLLINAGGVHAQIAGSTTLGISVEEMKAVAVGWSAKKQIIGKPVYNDANQKIGAIDDLIVTPDQAVSYVIIGAGGFLGLRKHDVAIPVTQIKADRGKFILPGATKENLKAMPAFVYAKQ